MHAGGGALGLTRPLHLSAPAGDLRLVAAPPACLRAPPVAYWVRPALDKLYSLVHILIGARMRPPSRQQRMEQFERACRERGLPLTIQRRIVFEALCEREDHPTADQVDEQVRSRLAGISRATVYRILDAFVRLGLVTRVCHPGSAARFDPKVHRHGHLVCMECERIVDVNDDQVKRIAWPDVRRLGFEIRDCQIQFRGICADCLRRVKSGRDARREATQTSRTTEGKRPATRSRSRRATRTAKP